MDFGWDPAKHARTLRERGIGFDLASEIFDQPVLQIVDARRDYGEVRVKAIGQTTDGRLLAVVYTDRRDLRWIISARAASRKERQAWQLRA
ncbi:MAG: BrnT family toxin [Rhodospirillales bacterium]